MKSIGREYNVLKKKKRNNKQKKITSFEWNVCVWNDPVHGLKTISLRLPSTVKNLRCLCILHLIVCLLVGNKIGVKGHLETLRFKIHNLIDLSTQEFLIPYCYFEGTIHDFLSNAEQSLLSMDSFGFYFSKQCVACYRCLMRLSQLMDIRRSAYIFSLSVHRKYCALHIFK